MSHLTKKLAEFTDSKPERELNANILFPELAKEIASFRDSQLHTIRGLFIVTVLVKGAKKAEW
jgi:hypothetical protein